MVRNALTSETLIDRYIDPNPWGGAGRHRAHLKKYGVSVWALTNRLNTGTSIPDLAREYQLPEEAVEAAKAFYDQNRAIIDAWILINESDDED